MDLGIVGKVAAVAASSQGLGFACARELAREGASLAICSRDRQRIDRAAVKIHEETGAKVHASVVDVSRQGDCIRFIEETVEKYGQLDILVTNTGGPAPGALDDINFDHVRDGFDSTLMSAIVMMKASAPHMRTNGWGRMINILSMTVKQPKVNLLVSNTMRPAILGFAKSISFELAADGVTVNNVAPGYTRTERLTELAEHLSERSGDSVQDVFAGWERTVPAQRLGLPEEMAAVVAFLASERAGYMTGVTIQVDGGSVLGLFEESAVSDVTVTFLGSGDAFANGGRFYTCFLVETPHTKFLLDCGATAAVAMKRYGIDTTELDAVILSHLHGDHFGGVPFVVLDSQYIAGRTAPLTVAGPPGVGERISAVMGGLYPSLMEPGHLRFAIDYVELLPATTQKIGDVVVTPQQVLHGEPGSTALALRVECDDAVIAFSGDTGWTEALLQVADGADLFICECSLYDQEIDGHLSYQTLLRRRDDFGCKRMVLTHMGPDVLARRNDLEIESASDGYQITL